MKVFDPFVFFLQEGLEMLVLQFEVVAFFCQVFPLSGEMLLFVSKGHFYFFHVFFRALLTFVEFVF